MGGGRGNYFFGGCFGGGVAGRGSGAPSCLITGSLDGCGIGFWVGLPDIFFTSSHDADIELQVVFGGFCCFVSEPLDIRDRVRSQILGIEVRVTKSKTVNDRCVIGAFLCFQLIPFVFRFDNEDVHLRDKVFQRVESSRVGEEGLDDLNDLSGCQDQGPPDVMLRPARPSVDAAGGCKRTDDGKYGLNVFGMGFIGFHVLLFEFEIVDNRKKDIAQN